MGLGRESGPSSRPAHLPKQRPKSQTPSQPPTPSAPVQFQRASKGSLNPRFGTLYCSSEILNQVQDDDAVGTAIITGPNNKSRPNRVLPDHRSQSTQSDLAPAHEAGIRRAQVERPPDQSATCVSPVLTTASSSATSSVVLNLRKSRSKMNDSVPPTTHVRPNTI